MNGFQSFLHKLRRLLSKFYPLVLIFLAILWKYLLPEMETAVNSLPDEILERIFSYCTHSDLVQSVQNVCCRWREVVQSTNVWKDVTYCPEYNTRSEQVVEMLKSSPKLQNIILQDTYDDRVLQAITDNCTELRKLQISALESVNMNFIKNLQGKCPNVQNLCIPHPLSTDLGKCEVTGKFTNLKVLQLTGFAGMTFSLILKPVADYCMKLECLVLKNCMFEVNDLRYLLTMRKDTLHTLGVYCCDRYDECVLPVLSTCELKSLSLFRYSLCWGDYEKMEHFGQLKTVKALLITTFSSEDLKQIFENENMAQLVELSREDSADFDHDCAEVIVRNCPLLKSLSLKGLSNMTDATLKTIANLKELSSLTIHHNLRVTDNGLVHLQDVSSLKCLRISWCEVGLGNITKLSTLQALTLECQDLAEFPWDLIPHHMVYLQFLCLRYCINVDMCAIEQLKVQLPYLKVLECSRPYKCLSIIL